MSDQTYHLTPEGLVRMRAELEELKGPKRQEIALRLRSAISMGDLSENADYHKAKEDQSFLEGRIRELETILQNHVVIEKTLDNGTVQLGSTVTVQEEDFPPEVYLMVGAKEANPKNGRISNESPIGSALIGRRAGEVVLVYTPGGELTLKILKIE